MKSFFDLAQQRRRSRNFTEESVSSEKNAFTNLLTY